MKIKMIILTLLLFLFSGCATFIPPWEIYSPRDNSDVPVRTYELDKEYKVSVGDVIVSAHKGTMETYYQPHLKDAVVWGGRTANQYEKWTPKYKFNGSDGDYILTCKDFFSGVIGVIVKDDGSIPKNPVVRVDGKGSTERFPIVNSSGSKLFFSRVTKLKNTEGNFKFELIYTGKENNSISVVYREYVDNFARNSFYQSLTYDLNESKIIKFKTLEIQVLDSTNSGLAFKVLKDDDLKWMP